jgi:S-DNA-T family DNA segregation ATPase FtsK/SpoIIIE
MTNPDREPREIDSGPEQGGAVVPFPGTTAPPEPEIIDAEIVEDAPAAPVPVNPLTEKQPVPWLRDAPVIRPVIPKWLGDPVTRKEAGRWVVRYSVHRVNYHAIRVPVYAVLTTIYAPRGGWRIVAQMWRYVTDAEVKPLTHSAVLRDSLEDYLKVARVRSDRVKFRRMGLVAGLLGRKYLVIPWGAGFRPVV